MWLNTTNAPSGTGNMGPFFCPEFFVNTGIYVDDAVTGKVAVYNAEWIVYIEGRGQRMNQVPV
jgi:hypothetical protein